MNDATVTDIIQIKNVEKTYVSSGEKLTILKDLDWSLPAGVKAVITGESGCGKSTFLNILSGIDCVTCGTVKVGDYIVSELDEDSLAKYRSSFLGLIFQFHYLLKDFTALENVFMPAIMAGLPKKTAEQKAKELLNEVGLGSRLNHLPSQLSGGERQRVAVARALINDPQLVLADEPTGNLDPANASMIGELLFSIVERYKKTLVLVTHDIRLSSLGELHFTVNNGRLEKKSQSENKPLAGNN